MAEDTRLRQEQIAAALRAQIMSGELRPDEQLPSTVVLMGTFSCTNTTVSRALDILKAEGLVRGQQGKGVFVRPHEVFTIEPADYFEPTPGGYAYKLLEVATVEPPRDVAVALGLINGETAVMRKRLTTYAGEPLELCASYYPSDIAEGTELAARKKIRGGAPRVLAEAGVGPQGGTDDITARPPTREETEVLAVPAGIPVLCTFRLVHTAGRRPVEVTIMVKPAHKFRLRYPVPDMVRD